MKRKQALFPFVLVIGLALTVAVYAQAPTRIVGSVTAISGRTLTIQPDHGAPSTVNVSDTARVLRTEPGAKTLSGATAMPLTDLVVGDRVLAIANGSTVTLLVAMKQSDIAEKRAAEAADWKRRGTGGIVKTVDAANGTIAMSSGVRTLTIHATPKTVVRRYSPDSAQFADSKPSTLAAIQPGDQLRVLGNRSADGSQITADEIVAGSFRNIAGIVLSTDPAENTIKVRDLATKKHVVIHITAQSQLHKLPPATAKAIAARFKKPSGQAGGEQHEQAAVQRGNAQASSDDLSRMLGQAPAIALSDLRKGDAVMIVATRGTPASTTAVTLLAGVEPILTASPSGSKNMFSASWNLGAGGTGGGGTGGGGGGGSTPQ